MDTELIDRARSGDQAAFGELVGPYRRQIQLHCYRFLGSVADAEDALQETLTAAWQGLSRFEGRASIRTWLYRIATNRCLNMLRAAGRRPVTEVPSFDWELPEPTRMGEVVWLDPYPDVLLADVWDTTAGPDVRYEARESISLAFSTALQLLPPRQRAALVLRDVLGFSTREGAEILDTSEDSVANALKRARATMSRELPSPDHAPPLPGSPAERAVLDRLVEAFESSDADALAALMTDDVWLRMPPIPLEYLGRELAREFFTQGFRQGLQHRRLVPTRANGQPAFGIYVRDPVTDVAHANGLLVITLARERVSVITRFESAIFSRFGLPRTLSE
jgi:RNA polymerase sigma-70 factor (ECF subfamily)